MPGLIREYFLKPSGRLIFLEHGRAADPSVALWQDRMTPAWERFGGGCHLNRRVDELITRAGFHIVDLRTCYLPGPRPVTYTQHGSRSRSPSAASKGFGKSLKQRGYLRFSLLSVEAGPGSIEMYGSLPYTCKTQETDMAAHAAMGKESKKERLEARLTPEQKKHIEHAARIKGTSVSDFVVLSADDAAVRTIREQEVLTLNEHARQVFANALLNPPAPSGRLVAAAKRCKERAKI